MKLKMIALGLVLPLFSASYSFAETAQFEVKGMHCGSCAKMIEAKVCKIEGLSKCEVKMGSISMISKAGVSIDPKKVQALVTEAGEEYSITKSDVKP